MLYISPPPILKIKSLANLLLTILSLSCTTTTSLHFQVWSLRDKNEPTTLSRMQSTWATCPKGLDESAKIQFWQHRKLHACTLWGIVLQRLGRFARRNHFKDGCCSRNLHPHVRLPRQHDRPYFVCRCGHRQLPRKPRDSVTNCRSGLNNELIARQTLNGKRAFVNEGHRHISRKKTIQRIKICSEPKLWQICAQNQCDSSNEFLK